MPGKYFAIYCRVSSEEQASRKEGSIVSQEQRCVQYLKLKYGESVWYQVYIDEAKTGRNADRAEYQRLLRDIKQGNVLGVIATELSRLGRSLTDLVILGNLCKDSQVIFISLKENFDTSTPIGVLLFHFFSALAEYESALVAERVRNNAQARKRRGLYVGGQPPFGYQIKKGLPGRLEINQEESQIVQLIFSQYLEQKSYVGLSKWLNHAGFLRRGKKWQKSTVLRILTNRNYLAQIILDDKEIIPATWEPIISQDCWQETQAILESKYIKQSHSHTFIVAGVVFCQVCQCFFETCAGTGKKGKVYYYYRHPKNQKKATCHFPKYVLADKLETELFQELLASLANKAFFDGICERVLSVRNEKISSIQRQIISLQNQLNGIEDKAQNLLDTIPKINEAEINAFVRPQVEKLAIQKATISASLEKFRKNLIFFQNSLPTLDEIQKIAHDLATLGSELSPARKRQIIAMLVEKIELTQDIATCYIKDFGQKKDSQEKCSCEVCLAGLTYSKMNPLGWSIYWNISSIFPKKHSIFF